MSTHKVLAHKTVLVRQMDENHHTSQMQLRNTVARLEEELQAARYQVVEPCEHLIRIQPVRRSCWLPEIS